MRKLLIVLAMIGSAAAAQPVPQSADIPKHVSKILASGDGTSKRTAYKVSSVHQEYEVLATLGLKPGTQSLVVDDKAYDAIDATDPRTGGKRTIWFDISSFFGKEW
ncbi:MAG TPA: DUF4919 domain-containing protein [Sphingomicrobium sp.]|nr:DUF4919 domain-containing protein [Sphingomicrobium sp.]